MTKQEKIQEAYGEDYDRIKLHIDENGWVDTQTFSLSRKGIEFDQYKKRSNTYLGFYNRPKSLQGIENNNRWIKIKSESDFPKKSGAFWIINKYGSLIHSDYLPEIKTFFHFGKIEATHYQPIIKPEKPLY